MFVVILDAHWFCSNAISMNIAASFFFSETSTISRKECLIFHLQIKHAFFLLWQIFSVHKHNLLKRYFKYLI